MKVGICETEKSGESGESGESGVCFRNSLTM